MSRLRLILLLALVTMASLASTAHAAVPKNCRLFSTSDVGKGAGYRGVSLLASAGAAPTLTGASGRLALCHFSSGRDYVAESSVMTFSRASTARAEYNAQVKARAKDDKGRHVSGPWRVADAFRTDEIFVLKGRNIFHLQYIVKSTSSAVRKLAVKAYNKL